MKAALDHLLERAPVLAGMKFVHWFDRKIEDSDDLMIQCGDFGDFGLEAEIPEESETPIAAEQEARDAVKRADAKVKSVFSGQINPELNDVRYYILLLTGVGGRVMVRRFERGNYRELHEKLETWYRDLQLVNLGGGVPMKPCKLTARLLHLLKYQKTDSRPFERLGKELSGITPAVISSVLTGSPLPDTVAAR